MGTRGTRSHVFGRSSKSVSALCFEFELSENKLLFSVPSSVTIQLEIFDAS